MLTYRAAMNLMRGQLVSACALAWALAGCGSKPSADDIRKAHAVEFLHAETVLKATMNLVNAAPPPALDAECNRGSATLTVAKAKADDGGDPAVPGNTELVTLLELTSKFVAKPQFDPSRSMAFRAGGDDGPLWITSTFAPRASMVPAIKSGKEITNLIVFKGIDPARVEVFLVEVAPLKLVCSFAVEGKTPAGVVNLDTVQVVNGKEVVGSTGAEHTAMVEDTLVRLDEQLEARFGVKRINRNGAPVVAKAPLSPDAMRWSARFAQMYNARDQEVPECTAKPASMMRVGLGSLGHAHDPTWKPPEDLENFRSSGLMSNDIKYMSASDVASLDKATGIVVVEPQSYVAPAGTGNSWSPGKLLGRTLVFDNQGKLSCRTSWELATPADMKYFVQGGSITTGSADRTARENLASQFSSFQPFK